MLPQAKNKNKKRAAIMPKKFAILRTKKIKTMAQLSQAGAHNNRAMPVPNADSSGKFITLMKLDDPKKKLESLLDEHDIKPRKNGVLAVELVMTFSPEMKGKIDLKSWAKENLKWAEKEFGKENFLGAQIHLDEATPHIHLIVAPIIEKTVRGKKKKRLSCRDLLGGREKLTGLQDRYAEAMAPLSLERGIRGSRAHHRTVKAFYSDLDKSVRAAERALSDIPEEPGILTWKKAFQELRRRFKAVAIAAGKLPKVQDRLDRITDQLRAAKQELAIFTAASGGLTKSEAIDTLKAASAAAEQRRAEQLAQDHAKAEKALRERQEARQASLGDTPTQAPPRPHWSDYSEDEGLSGP